ncbi:hypothetical protein NVP1113A_69 [Vibrio phage 1.113.A._10N.286.51.E7]|nr:hypothetical protein NVP1113A_69 [Vibrio phage 1.113.A._10N.286.51.E7]
MTTYNSYEEAKIANPGFYVLTKSGKFVSENELEPSPHTYEYRGIAKCNPSDHCVTVEKFLADGHEFVEGDLVLGCGDRVIEVSGSIYLWNYSEDADARNFILRAAALEEKKPRTKVEYVRCEYGDKASNIVMDFENDTPLYKMVNDEYWTIDELDDLFGIILDGGEHIYRRIETTMTEREAFVEALQGIWFVDGFDSAKQFDEIVDSGLFKLVN